MSIVIDASVALKWFTLEVGHGEARHLLAGPEPIIAPDLVIPETLNAAWKGVRRGFMTGDQAIALAPDLAKAFSMLVPSTELADRALEIALALDHPVYDGFYIALAEREGADLVTADDRLFRKTRGTQFAAIVRQLIAAP